MADTPQPVTEASALPGPLAPGTILQNRYAIVRLLGGGGMGMVYLAHDQRLSNRSCAIKEMVDHFIDPQQRREANEYFAREADTLAQLKHPAIPAISDRFDHQNRHYLVMEHVEGRNLEEELARRGEPLPEGLVIDIARQLCEVLAYLHGLAPPIIYRDMKPSNVMLTEKGRVVLVDFGIARLFKPTSKGTMIGTLGFAPPEQYQGVADPRSDIYSLGATLHYILTGRDPEKFPPFSFPPLHSLRADISRNLAGAIDHALTYDMNGRPATVHEFREMLLYGKGLGTSGAVNAKSGTAGLTARALPLPAAVEPVILRRQPVNHRRRMVALAAFSFLMAGVAFGATYVYSNPAVQQELGLKGMIDNLPWKHQQLVADARAHPLTFNRMTLQLSTRTGDPLSSAKASFTDHELATTRYLKWDATFGNAMTGLDGINDRVEARFLDPAGAQIASSADQQFVGPNQAAVDFSGVVLVPDSGTPAGNYKVALYSGSNLLSEQGFAVTEDVAAKNAAATAAAAAAAASSAAAAADANRRKQDAEKLAMVQERMHRPLELESVQFLNTTKDGTALSRPTDVFNASKVLFVGWRVTFQNRLFGYDNGQSRVDAAYLGPDGNMLGSVDDVQTVRQDSRRAVFSGRVGNTAGGAFLPGVYAVNFYLNGQYLTQKKFRVVADAAMTYGGGAVTGSGAAGGASAAGGGSVSSGGVPLTNPTVATGTIDGIGGRDNVAVELRLRPQPNGFLHGEMIVHIPGYGPTPIEGFVRGDHLQFQVPYGSETFYFEGRNGADDLSGTFESTPSAERGTWTTHTD